jgi:glycosyltransferase involved in cell wall biosynthesis
MDISKIVMNKSKVAFVIHGLPMGGAEKFLISLVNYFQRNNKNPLLILLSDDNKLINEVDEHVTIVKILKKNRFDVSISKRIKKEINSRNIKKIFCVNTYSFFLTKISFLRDKNVEFYLSPHTTIAFSFYNYIQNKIYTKTIGKNDTVIYLCNNQNQYYRKTYMLEKNKEMIVYNGVDTDKFDRNKFSEYDESEIKKEFGIKENEKIILMVARIEKEKNHKIAISAMSKLVQIMNDKVHLVFVGSGDKMYINDLKSYTQTLKIEKNIHFTGNSNDVGRYYMVADIFTLTSNSETFSIAALEAMSFGIPCALTNVGGASEMIDKNINGSIMNSNDSESIAKTWENVLTKEYIRQEIRNNIKTNFSIDKMLTKYNEILN